MDKRSDMKGPIFIVGAPRSGTTLLQYMLRSHPNISLPTGESHFMVPIYKSRKKFGDLQKKTNLRRLLHTMYHQSRDFLETDLHGIHFEIESIIDLLHEKEMSKVQDVFSWLLMENAKGEGKSRWGDKTPWYLLHMPMILEMFPDAQFIHIIRDGRDVAFSLFGRKEDFGVYNIFRAAEYWSIYMEKGQEVGSSLPVSTYMEVRYEDILANPEKECRRICRFLGEEFTDKIVQYRTSSTPGKTPLLLKPIQPDNACKWKNKMTKRQQTTFEAVAWDLLKRNGYETTGEKRDISFIEKFLSRFHNSFCNLIYRKKWVGLR